MSSVTSDQRPEPALARWRALRERALLPVAALGLAAGGLAWALSSPLAADLWRAVTALVLATLLFQFLSELRRGAYGLDLIAALAMGGALALGEPLAGAIIALMYTGGEALEAYAQRRASREMTALLGHLPRRATRYAPGDRDAGGLVEVDIADLGPGDRLLIRRGEVLPVDGRLASPEARLDQSALTGEALPVRHADGAELMSGAVNVGDAFDLLALHRADDSTYAGIVRLVAGARDSKAPMSRLADRYALGFLAFTLVLAGGAWLVSGTPLRALAVLVVATPCPLILAVPVAIIAGISRCAGRGVLVKNGGALEALAQVRVAVLDKTGTVTDGRPQVIDTLTRPGFERAELLRLAASLEQGSAHAVAAALVRAATLAGAALEAPQEVHERPGAGLEGRVGGHHVAVGGWDFILPTLLPSPAPDTFLTEAQGWATRPDTLAVAVAVEGRLAGVFLLADRVRPDAVAVLAHMRRTGIARIVLASGDDALRAARIAALVGADAAYGDMSPQDKVDTVTAERRGGPVMMIGDGVNDAPALAAADCGVAMGARGAAASSEAADVVLLVDELARLVEARQTAIRARAIALQSVTLGIGLSCAGMLAAAFGYLSPVEGALFQEVIDVAAILNALRALRGPARPARPPASFQTA